MFLSERATQAEYLDSPEISPSQVRQSFEELARINRLFLQAYPFQSPVIRWLGPERSRSLSILDLGGGDGSLARTLEAWAAQRGLSWQVTNFDLNLHALHLNTPGRNVSGSAVALPFLNNSFDLVIASQMTHHLSDLETIQHFREAWRVTRDALFLNDLHRNLALLAVVWLAGYCTKLSPSMRADCLLSVRRGWQIREWRELSTKAGIPEARVSLHFGARIFLQARKSSHLTPGPDPLPIHHRNHRQVSSNG